MALVLKMAAVAPLILMASLVLHQLITEASNQISPTTLGCPHSITYSFRCGNKALDDFLCTLVQFFKSALSTSHGVWISGYLLSVAMSSLAFIAVEASRHGNSWLLSLTPVYAFLFQACGISVVIPALWLPVYMFSNAGDRSLEALPRKKVSPRRVAFIKLSSLFMEVVCIGMLMPLKSLSKDLVILVFQFAPIICSMLWIPFTTSEATNQESGHKAVMLLHGLQAGEALAWHLVGVLMALDDPGLLSKVVQLLSHRPGLEWCAFFLLIDGIVLFVAFVYLICLEDGVLVSLSVLLATLLIGPGAALSLCFILREQRISTMTYKSKSQYL